MSSEGWQLSDEAAEMYETKMVPIALAEWAPRTADAAGVKRGDHILDVACGTGVVSRECVRRGASVSGLDLNESMLKVARRISPEVEWHLGDASNLPFDAGAFDAALCQFSLMYFPDPENSTREMWRVISPGGRLAVTVWNTINHMSALPVLVDIIERNGGSEVAETMRAPYTFGDEQRLTSIFADAGISEININTLAGTVRFESVDDFVSSEIAATPLATMLDKRTYAGLFEEARAELPGFHLGGNGFRFATSAHIVSANKL